MIGKTGMKIASGQNAEWLGTPKDDVAMSDRNNENSTWIWLEVEMTGQASGQLKVGMATG